MPYLRLPAPLLAALFVLMAHVAAAQTCSPVGQIISAQGQVFIQPVTATSGRQEAHIGDTVCSGDRVITLQYARANISVGASAAITQIDQNSTLQMGCAPAPAQSGGIDIIAGIAHIFTHNPADLQVCAPFVNAGIHGTEFLVEAPCAPADTICIRERGAGATRITMLEGNLAGTSTRTNATLNLASNEFATWSAVGASLPVRDPAPRERLRWSLYYLPLFLGNEPGLDTVLRQALAERRRGNFTQALAIAAGSRDTLAPVVIAELQLAVGRYDAAMASLSRAGALSTPEGGAVQVIIDLAQGRVPEAVALAQSATAVSSRTAAPVIALSYALQATGNQEAARDALLAGVQAHPGDGLVLARLAEVYLSLGDRKKSLDAANQAVVLAPDLGRAYTVKGFADLAVTQITAAKQDFATAIHNEPHDPLPRLGLGLAMIRQGDLDGGLELLEWAKSLDPDNSLVASYLGKGYYEAKRDDASARELQIAKELDPTDPTPYLYNAVRLQSDNRPVEALRDIETSITLNDNRAAFRSRLLLDEDLAVRSATAASIYRDLGFQQPALVEAYKSLALDQANFSAHRFLADSYVALPLHEEGRDSELLQAQLLQPINLNPVQSRLASDGLSFLDGFGPGSVSYNEFTPLFQRNGWRLVTDIAGGTQATFADAAAVSGIINNLSVSASQFHFQTDGFRPNNDDPHNIYDGFAQYAFDDRTSAEVEFRQNNLTSGDTSHYFFADNFHAAERDVIDIQTFRVGARHEFAPGSVFIGTYVRSWEGGSLTDFPFSLDQSESTNFGEVRQIQQGDHWSATVGAGIFRSDRTEITSLPFVCTPPCVLSGPISHNNAYAYFTFNHPAPLTTTLGVSYDAINDGIHPPAFTRTQVNPKVGFIWTPTPGTTIRGAAFRTLKRTVISSQTIEPTQVAGFNQFFDDTDGTDAWLYGLGIDQKVGSNIYWGLEASRRDLTAPVDLSSGTVRVPEREDSLKAYLDWTHGSSWAVSTGYEWFGFHGDPDGLDSRQAVDISLSKVPVELRYFSPMGWFARGRATFVAESGTFRDSIGTPTAGRSTFVTVDVGAGLRLPNRRGVIGITINNVFDQHFQFQDYDPRDPTIMPARQVLGRLALVF